MARVGSDWSLGFYSGSIIPPVELKKFFLQDTFCEILFSSRNIYKFEPLTPLHPREDENPSQSG